MTAGGFFSNFFSSVASGFMSLVIAGIVIFALYMYFGR